MSVDLRSNTTFSRISMVLMDDCLVKLEHQTTQDRVRRYAYDRIQGVVIWTRPAWLRMAVCAVGLLAPGILLGLLTQELQIFGWILASIGLLLVCWYAYTKVATIRIIRAGKTDDLKGLYRPGRLNRFRDKLIARIQEAQSVETIETPIVTPSASDAPAAIAPDTTPTSVSVLPTAN